MGAAKRIQRRDFFKLSIETVAGLIGLQAILTACGGSGGYGGGGSPAAGQGGNCLGNGTVVSVGNPHSPTNHVVTISQADVAAGVQQTYTLTDNGTGHTHQVTLSAADFASLQNNQGVQVFSTGGGHTHLVTVNCA
ncbi:MAG: hypothetical protein AB7N80_14580 [Bdellovibrionales bacterium]